MKKMTRNKNGQSRRTFIAALGSVAFLYPVLQFVGFKIPKKPNYIKINTAVNTAGFLLTSNFILFDRGEKYWALSRKCTHLGCKLNYQEKENILECPCHQSRFNIETGEVMRGPAKRPLPFLPVEKRQDPPLYVVTT